MLFIVAALTTTSSVSMLRWFPNSKSHARKLEGGSRVVRRHGHPAPLFVICGQRKHEILSRTSHIVKKIESERRSIIFLSWMKILREYKSQLEAEQER